MAKDQSTPEQALKELTDFTFGVVILSPLVVVVWWFWDSVWGGAGLLVALIHALQQSRRLPPPYRQAGDRVLLNALRLAVILYGVLIAIVAAIFLFAVSSPITRVALGLFAVAAAIVLLSRRLTGRVSSAPEPPSEQSQTDGPPTTSPHGPSRP